VNNVREGVGITYHLNGKIEIKADFKEGRMRSYEQFDENGSPKQTLKCDKAIMID
jgi:antitoxin component YwqK of YwqJK toxin-antitoxin module